MNIKQIVSLVILAGGIGLALYANHAKGKVSEARSIVNKVGTFFTGADYAKDAAEHKLSDYDAEVRNCFYGSVLLIVAGIGGFLYFRQR